MNRNVISSRMASTLRVSYDSNEKTNCYYKIDFSLEGKFFYQTGEEAPKAKLKAHLGGVCVAVGVFVLSG